MNRLSPISTTENGNERKQEQTQLKNHFQVYLSFRFIFDSTKNHTWSGHNHIEDSHPTEPNSKAKRNDERGRDRQWHDDNCCNRSGTSRDHARETHSTVSWLEQNVTCHQHQSRINNTIFVWFQWKIFSWMDFCCFGWCCTLRPRHCFDLSAQHPDSSVEIKEQSTI